MKYDNYTYFKVHLQLKPQAVPVFHTKRQVAYAAKDYLDNELKKFERECIISPINFSERAALYYHKKMLLAIYISVGITLLD